MDLVVGHLKVLSYTQERFVGRMVSILNHRHSKLRVSMIELSCKHWPGITVLPSALDDM